MKKLEFIILGVLEHMKKVGNIAIRIGEDIIHNVPAVKNLGMFLDAELKHYSHHQTHNHFLQHPT